MNLLLTTMSSPNEVDPQRRTLCLCLSVVISQFCPHELVAKTLGSPYDLVDHYLRLSLYIVPAVLACYGLRLSNRHLVQIYLVFMLGNAGTSRRLSR